MKTIFITGAGAGIGRATAILFAANNWFVGAADRDTTALTRLQEELGEQHCSIHELDVTNPDSIHQALMDFSGKTAGKLDVLHNNAGILKVGPFEQIPLDAHKQIMDVNVTGLINVLHAAFPLLAKTENALVINMSSASAAYGTPDFASYSASKHAVRAMTEALDIEWRGHDIRVTDLMPPFVNTGMVKSNEQQSHIFRNLGVNLSAEEVARAVWQQVQAPLLHRPVSLQFRLLWPFTRSAPAAITRRILQRMWQD